MGVRLFLTSLTRGVWGAVHTGVPGDRERAEGERPGSDAFDSDGKPCSGVRGGQGAPTEFPARTDRRSGRHLATQGENAVRAAVFSLPFFFFRKKKKQKEFYCATKYPNYPGLQARRQNLFELSSEKEPFFMKSNSTKKLAR